ncbi:MULTISPECIES: quinolinate synthase NadA [Dictyoglomus]|jgi:quinolinate synthase|uniref:Quinolinate synthase n=1 Tax=Dictyoglomus turgidum (strain DSM 6724 / Z-1310) TaxID=515635 RepID=B8DZV3_DICTD|nr:MULTISPECIES: quinolinate synthase NadA [Dictyoglomus]ACK42036.1 quinolinate synthetase complex, A subunit [Dictyoglomus turgidum DSM 6724]PNV80885.1 MAG: quinolinate synthase NadA [Dictyoglomus turgidum]HBU31403.1 quinolinate synthase NadA [Dictyoglomus sp.]
MTIQEKIQKLKKEKNAIILAHNYQLPEVQDIADFVGDSLELARISAQVKEEVIIFCGVHFMAETASILAPDKKVILPDLFAGCPLANTITPREVKELKEKYPNYAVVAYVNTSAEVKAESDYICTSANATFIVEKIPEEKVIFIPDRNLGYYVSKHTKKEIIIWNGFCPTHQRILPQDIIALKEKYKDAKVVVHPECRKEVLDLADKIASTSGIIKFVKEDNGKRYIIGTEVGLLHRLRKENPEKEFYLASPLAICPNMKKITLDKILTSLENLEPEVKVEESTREKAIKPIERMLSL